MERLPTLGTRVLVASRQDPQKNRLRGPGERFRTNGPQHRNVGWSVWARGVRLALGKAV